MGTGRAFRKKTLTRPRKGSAGRRRREASQKKRLIGLGMNEEIVVKMTGKDVRLMLRKPAKLAAVKAK